MTAVPRGGPGLLLVRKSAPEWERFQFKTNKNFRMVKTIQERTDDVILRAFAPKCLCSRSPIHQMLYKNEEET